MLRKKPLHKQGQAAISIVILFLIGSLTVMGGISFPILKEIQAVTEFLKSKQSYYLSEAALEDVAYRIAVAKSYDSNETLILNGNTATTTVTDTTNGKEIISEGNSANRIRKTKMGVTEGSGASFFYGMQAEVGGVLMENASSISGNLYSNGPINGAGANIISGDVVSASSTGLIDGVHATGSAFAHTIQNSEIDKDAYYYTDLINTTVWGTSYPESPDQATTSLPISDAQIDQWKADAEAGGVHSSPCPYDITTDVTIGPLKIACDVLVDQSSEILTLGGPVWVVGNVDIKNNSTVRVDPTLVGQSIPFIADNPSDRDTSSKIIIQNFTQFVGAGTNSYILMISQNNSSELGGSEVAMDVKNESNGDFLVYAAHGELLLQNDISLTEATAYKIHIKNDSKIIYETGLASLLFTSGPGGGFVVDSWSEVE